MGQKESAPDFALPQQQIVTGGHNSRGGHPSRPSDAVVRTQMAAASAKEVSNVSLQLVWDKTSVKLSRIGGSKTKWQVSASFTGKVECELSMYFHCRETPKDRGLLDFVPASQPGPEQARQRFAAGTHTACVQEIDFQRWPLEVYWKYNTKHQDIIPIVFSLSAQGMQSLMYLTLHQVAGNPPLACSIHSQKAVVDGNLYTIQEVFGLSELGKDQKNDESAAGQPCVICLTDPRDTAVLPCNHLCVCKDCAGCVSAGDAKCPICRGKVTGLQVFDFK